MLIPLLCGLGVGTAQGMLGAGGSILAVPVLVYALGEDVSLAVPTSLLVVGIASLAGVFTYVRAGRVPWLSALIFGGAGIAGSFLGTWMNHRLNADVILVGFSLLMLAAAFAMTRKRPSDTRSSSCERVWRKRPLAFVVIGCAVGVLTGLFGVGGGFLIVPVWTLALGCGLQVSVAASLVVIVLNSAGGLISYGGLGSIDASVAIPFLATAMIGAVFGGMIASHIDEDRASRWFAYFVAVVAVFIFVEVLLPVTPAHV